MQSIQNNPKKSYTEKKLDMSLPVGHYIQDVHLRKKKINLITIDEKFVLKKHVKKIKECAMEIINCKKKKKKKKWRH